MDESRMKRASRLFLAAILLLVVNVEQSAGVPQAPAGYQKYKPYDPVPIDENITHFNTAGQLKTGRLFAEGYLELMRKTDRE
jgi:hypothetical protein